MIKKLVYCLIALSIECIITSCSNQQKEAFAHPDEESIVEQVDNEHKDVPPQEIEEEKFTIEAVDLGLSVLWANANIGARNVYDPGDYYAWGESSQKATYTFDNYFDYYIEVKEGGYVYRGFKIFTKAGQSLVGTEYDTAHNLLGDGWRMPTSDEYNELRDNCKTTIKQQTDSEGKTLKDEAGNKLPGYIEVKAPNGKIILFPCGGYKIVDSHEGKDGFFYWAANLRYTGSENEKAMTACIQNYNYGSLMSKPNKRGYGMNVRAVKDRDASKVSISDGEYRMKGRINNKIVNNFKDMVNDFVLIINGSDVEGRFLYPTDDYQDYINLKGTKDEHNNIKLKKTRDERDMGRLEGVFDGIAFRGTDYQVDGEGSPFKMITKSIQNLNR